MLSCELGWTIFWRINDLVDYCTQPELDPGIDVHSILQSQRAKSVGATLYRRDVVTQQPMRWNTEDDCWSWDSVVMLAFIRRRRHSINALKGFSTFTLKVKSGKLKRDCEILGPSPYYRSLALVVGSSRLISIRGKLCEVLMCVRSFCKVTEVNIDSSVFPEVL